MRSCAIFGAVCVVVANFKKELAIYKKMYRESISLPRLKQNYKPFCEINFTYLICAVYLSLVSIFTPF